MAAAVEISNLSKNYRLGVLGGRTLLEDVRRWWAKRTGAPNQTAVVGIDEAANVENDRIWALRDITFSVDQGHVIGIIGHNGAGKSTLLKILSRITAPTTGRAIIRGRVGSLLEVGTGFHKELTGRENIYLNGAILGMTRDEVNQKLDEIVAFSGVERFIDTPVKRYSSGMTVRLAFAVAAHLDPEILLVDEVLAVGDVAFQEKCVGKMRDVVNEGRTVLFVSHNMTSIRNLCDSAILLENGEIRTSGDAALVISEYLQMGRPKTEQDASLERVAIPIAGRSRVRAVSFQVRSLDSESVGAQVGVDTEFILGYVSQQRKRLASLLATITIYDADSNSVLTCSTGMTKISRFYDIPAAGLIVCRVPELPLAPGKYRVEIRLKDDFGTAEHRPNAATFSVVNSGATGHRALDYGPGSIILSQDWEWLPADFKPEENGNTTFTAHSDLR